MRYTKRQRDKVPILVAGQAEKPRKLMVRMEDFGKKYSCTPSKRESIPKYAKAIAERFINEVCGTGWENRLQATRMWVNKRSIVRKFEKELYRQWDSHIKQKQEDDCINC